MFFHEPQVFYLRFFVFMHLFIYVMRNNINLTSKDIRHIINEVCRKLAYLNESVEEGGAAGHMSHPFEVDEFTFGDYKQLVQDLFDSKIEKFTEKLDGMNIFATVDDEGTVRFARNSTDLKNGGMDPEGMAQRWGSDGKDPTILGAYTKAYNLFGDITNMLPDPVGFFNGNGYRIYANCEVIAGAHPNVILYPKDVLSFHGLAAFTTDGNATEVNLPDRIFDEKMDVLTKLLPSVKSDYGEAQITPEVVIDVRENNEETAQYFIALIDHITDYAGVDDNTTIIDYRAKLLPEWMEDNGYGILLDNEFTDYFMKRWVYGIKEPNIGAIKKEIQKSGNPNAMEICDAAVSFEGKFRAVDPVTIGLKTIMEPVEMFFYRLGNEIIKRCKDYTNLGREGIVLDEILKQLAATQELLNKSDDLDLQEKMTYLLQRLSELDFKYNSMEGVVFNYRGHTFKLTGSFAALNRAINLRIDYGRKHKNDA